MELKRGVIGGVVLALLVAVLGVVVPGFSSLALLTSFLILAGVSWLAITAQRQLRILPSALEETKLNNDQLTQEIQRHRDALDDLADGLDVLILLTDRNLNVVYANTMATQVFGGSKLIGQSLVAATVSTELSGLVQKAWTENGSVRAEITLRKPSERTFLAHAWVESSEENRSFLALNDVTEIRRLERVRRDFVANVSHELRTPMTTIRAMAEILEEGGESEAVHEQYLSKIIREVDRLTSITDDLLTLSIAESGAVTKTEIDGVDIVKGVVVQLTSKAEQKGLDLRYSGAQNARINVNEHQFAQIALNLIDNAINYTSSGEIVVSCGIESDHVIFEVRDTGIGISSEHLPRIFERFYRVDKGRSRGRGGTGLGLSIVRHLAESHGGRVSVQSELNKGSSFKVMLPLI